MKRRGRRVSSPARLRSIVYGFAVRERVVPVAVEAGVRARCRCGRRGCGRRRGDVDDLEQKSPLKTCYDPEIPSDIYELRLIYSVKVETDGKVDIQMTLTSPACPVAGSLPPEVETKVKGVEGVADCKVEIVWDPPWNPR